MTEREETRMASYTFSQIKETDTRAHRQWQTLLADAGIPGDQPADFILGVFDEDYHLVAAGSTHKNHLHSLVVDKPYRKKGLLNQLLTHLYEIQFSLGYHELYLKAKPGLVPLFNSFGFYEIASAGEVIYMGNKKAISSREAVISA